MPRARSAVSKGNEGDGFEDCWSDTADDDGCGFTGFKMRCKENEGGITEGITRVQELRVASRKHYRKEACGTVHAIQLFRLSEVLQQVNKCHKLSRPATRTPRVVLQWICSEVRKMLIFAGVFSSFGPKQLLSVLERLAYSQYSRRFLAVLQRLMNLLNVQSLRMELDSFVPPSSPEGWSVILRHLVERSPVRSPETSFLFLPILEALCKLQHYWVGHRQSMLPKAVTFSREMWVRTLSLLNFISDEMLKGGRPALKGGIRSVSFLCLFPTWEDVEDVVWNTAMHSWSQKGIEEIVLKVFSFSDVNTMAGLSDMCNALDILGWGPEAYRAFAESVASSPVSQLDMVHQIVEVIRDSKMSEQVPHVMKTFFSSAFMKEQCHMQSKTSCRVVSDLWLVVAKGWKFLSLDSMESIPKLQVILRVIQIYGISSLQPTLDILLHKEMSGAAACGVWFSTFVDLSDLLLNYRASHTTFLNVMKGVKTETFPDNWFLAGSRIISDAAFGETVTLTLESTMEMVLRDQTFNSNPDTRRDLLNSVRALSSAGTSPSTLLAIAREWVETKMEYNTSKNPHKEKKSSHLFAFFKTDEELSLFTLSESVSQCSRFRTKNINQWTEDNIKQWGMVISAMHEHNYAALPLSSRVDLRAEIAAVVIRAATIFNSRGTSTVWELKPTQLVAIVLYIVCPGYRRSKILQISTGEGKSWIMAIVASCFALLGRAVDVMAPSKELAVRDELAFHSFFEMMNLHSSCCCTEVQNASIYAADIVYGDELHFSGDWLRSQFFRMNTRGKRPFAVCLVDEVDNLLVDRKEHAVQISSNDPGVAPLSLLLGCMWKNTESTFNHIVEDPQGSGTYYFVPTEFSRDADGTIVTKDPARPYAVCRQPLDGKNGVQDYLTRCTRDYTNLLLTPLTATDIDKKKTLKAMVNKFSEKHRAWLDRKKTQEDGCADGDDNAEVQELVALQREMTILEESVRVDPLELPQHQLEFAKKNASTWTDSAVKAILHLKCGKEYEVIDNKIKVVDYSDTGTIFNNMVWSDALHQFLELKEGLPITPLTCTKCFLSSTGYFHMYGDREHPEYTNIYGMTGTLGDTKTKRFLAEQYSVDMLVIPPHRKVVVRPDEAPWSERATANSYAAKELTPLMTFDAREHSLRVFQTCTAFARMGRAILVIVPHIEEVRYFYEYLSHGVDRQNIYCFDGVQEFNHMKLDCGEIVVATNIAGRGQDFIPSDAVEANGGLHVCITFLPESIRVELQNAGRTSRQGRRGTVQLILQLGDATMRCVADLKAYRDALTERQAEEARKSVAGMRLRDHLLRQFCILINEVLGEGGPRGLDFLVAVQDARTKWESWFDKEMSPGNDRYQEAFRIWRNKKTIDKIAAEDNSDDDEMLLNTAIAFISSDRPALPCQQEEPLDSLEEAFRKDYVEETKKIFVRGARIPNDVLEEAFRPPNADSKMNVDDTKEEELEALKELWGHWLALQNFHNSTKRADVAFKEFESDVRWRVQSGNIITNPHHYVLKGNRLLAEDQVEPAMAAYNKAIAMEPKFMFIAHFYKAIAIIASDGRKGPEAILELERAKKLIEEEEMTRLNALLGVTCGPGKDILVYSIGTQINFLEVLVHVIEHQITVLRSTKDVEKFTVKEGTTLVEFLKANSMPSEIISASESFTCDGLNSFYEIDKVGKIPVKLIVGLLCASALFVGIGAVCVHYGWGTLGAGFIAAGVSDGIDGLKRIWTRDNNFNFQKYAIHKVADIAVGAACNWMKFSSGASRMKGTMTASTFNNLSFTKLSSGPLVRDIFLNEVKRCGISEVLHTISTEVINQFAPSCFSHVLKDDVSKETSYFISHDSNFKSCVQADVVLQGMQYELALRDTAKYTAQTKLHTLRRSLSSGFAGTSEERSWLETAVDEVFDCAVHEFEQGSLCQKYSSLRHLGTGLSLYDIVMKSKDVKSMPSKFFVAYAKEIKDIGKEASKLVTEKTSANKTTREVKIEESSSDNTRKQVVMTTDFPSVNTRDKSLSLPSNAKGFDSEEISATATRCSREEKAITCSMQSYLESVVINGIERSVRNEVVPLVSSKLSSYATRKICKKQDEEVRKRLHEYELKCDIHNLANDRCSGSYLQEESHYCEITKAKKNILSGGQLGLAELMILSDEKKVRVEVYNDKGDLESVLGEQYPEDSAVRLCFTNGCHYTCLSPKRTVIGGENDCLLESFLSGLPDDKYDGEGCCDMRQCCAERIGEERYRYGAMLERGNQLQQYEINPLMNGGMDARDIIKKIFSKAGDVVLNVKDKGVWTLRKVGDGAIWIVEQDAAVGNWIECKTGYDIRPSTVIVVTAGCVVAVTYIAGTVAIAPVAGKLTALAAKRIALGAVTSFGWSQGKGYLKAMGYELFKGMLPEEDRKRLDAAAEIGMLVSSCRGIYSNVKKGSAEFKTITDKDFRSSEKKEALGYLGIKLDGEKDERFKTDYSDNRKKHPISRWTTAGLKATKKIISKLWTSTERKNVERSESDNDNTQ